MKISEAAISAAAKLSDRYIAARFLPNKGDCCDATEAWKKERGASSQEVTAEDIAHIVSTLTGMPVSELTAESPEKLLCLEDRLKERVVGQDEAISAVAKTVRLARAGLTEGGKPTASFLFLGQTGVCKTELATALSTSVFGDDDALVRIDMSEYGERHIVARLVGARPGHVGYEECGQFTERVRRRPYGVVLLDEFEKAH
ncbi:MULTISPECIES: AAA family ATPase [Paraburkholderia]|uniref:AAA family ATPase n=1 Tax=Paraburkholderia TaxID=1822464 RepID=UPI0038B6DBE7